LEHSPRRMGSPSECDRSPVIPAAMWARCRECSRQFTPIRRRTLCGRAKCARAADLRHKRDWWDRNKRAANRRRSEVRRRLRGGVL
jgi:hypothetical protein